MKKKNAVRPQTINYGTVIIIINSSNNGTDIQKEEVLLGGDGSIHGIYLLLPKSKDHLLWEGFYKGLVF